MFCVALNSPFRFQGRKIHKGIGVWLWYNTSHVHFTSEHNGKYCPWFRIGWVKQIESCGNSFANPEFHINWNNSFVNLVELDEVPEVKTVVHGVIMGMEMPFPLPNPDACKDSGLSCPLKKGQSYEYVASLPVLRAYPKVNTFECNYNRIFRKLSLMLVRLNFRVGARWRQMGTADHNIWWANYMCPDSS